MFFIGGTLQLLGIFTITETTMIVLILVTTVVLYNFLYKYIYVGIVELLLLLLLGLILYNGHKNNTSMGDLFYYSLFVLVPLFLFQFQKISLKHINLIKLKNILFLIAFIQLPLILLQSIFGFSIMSISSYPISMIDIKFGSFFLKSDHTLGCFLISILLLLFYDESLTKFRKIKIGYILVTIFSLDSKTTILLSICLSVIYLFKFKRRFSFLLIGILFLLVLLLPEIYGIVLKYKNLHIPDFSIFKAVELKNAGLASRPIAMYSIFAEPLNFFGSGLYSFKNNLNIFSQFHWFYEDLGLVGLIVGIAIIVAIWRKNGKHCVKLYKVSQLGVAFVYLLVTNMMLAPGIIFILMIFPLLTPQFHYRCL